jgi:hypothetical protein
MEEDKSKEGLLKIVWDGVTKKDIAFEKKKLMLITSIMFLV